MRLRLHPDVVVAWRGPASLQVGLGPDHGVVFDDLSPGVETVMAALRAGEHCLPALHALGRERGVPEVDIDRLVDTLHERGVILGDHVIPLVRRRSTLMPVARSATLRREGRDGWLLINQRLMSRVLIVGADYFGSRLARLLVAAGIGEVLVHDPRPVGARDLADGEVFLPSDIGRPRQQAIADRLPGVVPIRDPADTTSSLAVLVGTGALDPLAWEPFLRNDRRHLPLVLGERDATIGPLVVPGSTCCLRCIDLYRSDRDPSWPAVAAQASTHEFGPRDPLLLDLASVTTAAQVLLAVESPGRCALEGSTLEVGLDQPIPTVRRWPAHPRCGCTWPPAAST